MASEKVAVDSSENKAMEQKKEERRCYVCYSCPRVEKSQSILCQEEGENQCMVCAVKIRSNCTVTEWALCKWGNFKRAKATLEVLPAPLNANTFEEGFRSFRTSNIGSVNQTAANLLSVNFGGKKSLPPSLGPSWSRRPGFNPDWVWTSHFQS